MRLIDKDALVAEIERRRNDYINSFMTEQVYMLNNVLDFIDTLEVKDLQEEPVSEELEEVARNYGDELDSVLCACEDDDSSTGDYATEAFKAGAQWQKRKDSASVSVELEEASKEWLKPQLDKSYANYGETKQMELTHFDGYAMLDAIEFGAKWGKNQAMAEIQAQSMALVHSCPKELESEDLKEAAKQYLESSNPDKVHQITNAFNAGAQWQKAKYEYITDDLGEYINELSKQFPEVSFAKLSRIAVRVAKWQKENMIKND